VVANTGIEPELFTQLSACHRFQLFGEFACRVVEITEEQGIVSLFLAGFHAGGNLARIHTMNTKIAPLHGAFASWAVRALICQGLMDKGAGLVGAGDHAVTTANAAVTIHQYDAILPLKGCTGGADINAGRVFTVLAHHGQFALPTGLFVLQVDQPYPLGIGLGSAVAGQTMLFVAGCDTGITPLGAPGGIYQHSPAHLVTGGFG